MRAGAAAPAALTRLGTLDRGVLEALLAPRRTAVDVVEVGLLLRAEDQADDLGATFVPALADGLDEALAERTGIRVELRPTLVEAPYRGAAVSAARLLEDGVRVIVAALPESAVRRLAPLCAQYGAALVVVGTGSEATEDLRGVVRITEDRAGVAHALGAWAARYLKGGLFQVVAAPDAAFEVVSALQVGYVSAGGDALGQATTYDAATGSGAAAAALAAHQAGAHTVAVHASGARATEIVRALRAGGTDVDVLVVGPTQDRELAALGGRCGAVFSAVGATPALIGRDLAAVLVAGAERLADQSRPWSHLREVVADLVADLDARRVTVRRADHGRHPATVARRSSSR